VYLGQPVLINDLLYEPDSSLVKQSFMPKKLKMLNLAGFGMMAWDPASHNPSQPYRYASTELPVFDRNLKSLSEKIQARCVLAHVRGVTYSTKATISNQNTHPFNFPNCSLAMAHNGDLYKIRDILPTLKQSIRPEMVEQIQGTTDSEWIYALILSQLDDPYTASDVDEIKRAVEESLRIISAARERHEISISSSVNLFITDGDTLVAVRYCFDFGCYKTSSPEEVHEANFNFLSLWYTTGREFGFHEGEWKMIGGSDTADSIIVASEPLTEDTSSWLEVPEYSMLSATTGARGPVVSIHYLDV